MSLECFREAIQSLRDWPGVIGIFGGNPCNHPKFPELCEILCEEIPDQRHRGLWSNDLLQHGEIARKTFYPNGRFNLNAHAVSQAAQGIEQHLPGKIIKDSVIWPATHSAILAHHEDYGVGNALWNELRERCDINLKWSGAIAERDGKPFAYFCEVAAALDGVRGTNHGMPVVPGWWRQGMEAPDFQTQIKKCCDAGCGVPLHMRGHKDFHETYDISPSWAMKLPEKPRGNVKVQVHDDFPGGVPENTDYMHHRTERQ